MRVEIYGTFLLTGQTEPLGPALRREIVRCAAATVKRAGARVSLVRVVVVECIGAMGERLSLCRMTAQPADCNALTAEAFGRGARVALRRAAQQLEALLTAPVAHPGPGAVRSIARGPDPDGGAPLRCLAACVARTEASHAC